MKVLDTSLYICKGYVPYQAAVDILRWWSNGVRERWISQNYRMLEVGGDFWWSPGVTPTQARPPKAACLWPCFQGGRLHTLSWAQSLSQSKVLPCVQMDHPVFQLVPITSDLLTQHKWKEPGFIFFCNLPSGVCAHWWDPPWAFSSPGCRVYLLSFSWCDKYSRPFISFVAFHWTCSSSSISFVQGSLELDTVLQMWSCQRRVEGTLPSNCCPFFLMQSQIPFCLPSSQGSLLASIQLGVHQHPQSFLQSCFPAGLLQHVLVLLMVWGCSFLHAGLSIYLHWTAWIVELHVRPFLWPIQVPLVGIITLTIFYHQLICCRYTLPHHPDNYDNPSPVLIPGVHC